jgi:hypothetical protein
VAFGPDLVDVSKLLFLLSMNETKFSSVITQSRFFAHAGCDSLKAMHPHYTEQKTNKRPWFFLDRRLSTLHEISLPTSRALKCFNKWGLRLQAVRRWKLGLVVWVGEAAESDGSRQSTFVPGFQ